MREALHELWRFRELLYILVVRDLKVRYKNSALGFGWSLLNPLVQVGILTVVIKFLMRSGSPNYHAYVFCATLPWLFFSNGVMDGSMALLHYRQVIRRTYFPRALVPLAYVLANLVHFGLSTAALLVYIAGNSLVWWAATGQLDWPIQWTTLLIPIPMLGLLLLLTGISFFVSVWTLFLEDIRFVLQSLLQVFYWMVPVIYFPDMVLNRKGTTWYTLYMLNPVSAFIDSFRKLILPPTEMPGGTARTWRMDGLDWAFLAIALLTALVIFMLGFRFFDDRKWSLAEQG